MSSQKKILSILVPVYNEENVIQLFFERMLPVYSELSKDFIFHLVFLNNASNDKTFEIIKRIREKHPFVFLLSLSKNVGYQRSLEFGLKNCLGDLFVFIDVDCEDPPEMILEFIKKHKEGFDIVYGERADRDELASIKFLRKVFYRVLRAIADEEVVLDMAEFSLMTNEVRQALIQDSSSFPFIRASIGRIGFRRAGIAYRRQKRIAGKTHYNVLGMITFAVAGMLSTSTLILRAVIYLLPVWIIGMVYIGLKAIQDSNPWMVVILLMFGFIYCGIALAFISIYLARIYKNTLGRPNAFLDDNNSFPQPVSE
jgi:glycosyltransferase involved in cell wall biosynthesis